MMQNTFLRRLFYYLIGVGIGLLFVFFVFGNRGCSWLPQNKVKETINHKILISTSKKVSSKNFKQTFEVSEVNFEKSNKNSDFKTYLFETPQTDGKSSSFYVSFSSDSYCAIVHDDQNQPQLLKTDTFLKIINLPEDKYSLFNFDVNQLILKDLNSVKFDRENYSKTLINSGFLVYNFLKNNDTEGEFLLKNGVDSTRIFCNWKDVILTPVKVKKKQ